MKIAPKRIPSFLKTPDPKARAILVYGRDAGEVQERLAALVSTVLDDPKDPFRLRELNASDIKKDAAKLRDEAAAQALGGGRCVLQIRSAGDDLTSIFRDFLGDPSGDALLLLGAGDLGTRSTLRKFFERADNAATLPCYGDTGSTLTQVINDELAGVEITDEARGYLLAHLGADRMVTRRELEKLALYMDGETKITLPDVLQSIGDSSTLTLEDIAFAVGRGAREALEQALARTHLEGTSPIAILRATSQHFLRLHLVRGRMERGEDVSTALQALRPPVFFKRLPAFREQAARWQLDAIGRVLELLGAREVTCKSGVFPAKAICDRTLLEIAVRGGGKN